MKGSMSQLHNELERNKADLIKVYEQKYKDLERELELRMKIEIHEMSERKNQHINDLMKSH